MIMKSLCEYVRISILFLLFSFFLQKASGQTLNKYEINADVAPMKIYSDHLKLGGSNSKGETISVNNYFK